MHGANSAFVIWPIIMMFLYLCLTGLAVYAIVLFIKLAHRGIKALDIYIDEKTK
jgi:hypothetical protein